MLVYTKNPVDNLSQCISQIGMRISLMIDNDLMGIHG